MSRTWSISMLALAWLGLAACQSGAGSSSSEADASTARTTRDAGPSRASEPIDPAVIDPVVIDPAVIEPAVIEPAAPAPEGGFTEAPSPAGDAALGPAPAWFRPDAFEHTAILRQDLAGSRVPSGQTSAMIVLELPAATTPEQCVEQFRAKIAETVKDPPTSSTMPQGHLSLRGKGDGYEYTVVCGVAKGKPTMFLSYSQ